MKKNLYAFSLICLIGSSLSCQTIAEPFKVTWGSSTKALEEARIDAISKTYECEFDGCFDAVLSLERQKTGVRKPVQEETTANPDTSQVPNANTNTEDQQGFEVFIKDRIKAFIVVMGLYDNTYTTEAGIFFSRYNRSSIKVEVTSLSDSAKRRLAEMVFQKLDQQFKEIK